MPASQPWIRRLFSLRTPVARVAHRAKGAPQTIEDMTDIVAANTPVFFFHNEEKCISAVILSSGMLLRSNSFIKAGPGDKFILWLDDFKGNSEGKQAFFFTFPLRDIQGSVTLLEQILSDR